MAGSEAGLGLGSNIGDKAANIREAARLLCADGRVRMQAMSSIYRTAPWGVVEQDFFANAAAIVRTRLEPLELLAHAKSVERAMGRAAGTRWGPRLIDIDILYFGGRALESEHLTLPHRDLFNRAFVLVPLAEIAPELVLDGRSVREAASAMKTLDVVKWNGI